MNELLQRIIKGKGAVPYFPELKEITGSVTAAILLQKILYRWHKNGKKPFYKFKQSCSHQAYRSGDSWCEELAFSKREFDTAIGKIGKRIKEKNKDKNALIWYWSTYERLTYYHVNTELLINLLEKAKAQNALYLNTETGFAKSAKRDLPKTQNGIYEDAYITKRDLPKAQNALYLNTETGFTKSAKRDLDIVQKRTTEKDTEKDTEKEYVEQGSTPAPPLPKKFDPNEELEESKIEKTEHASVVEKTKIEKLAPSKIENKNLNPSAAEQKELKKLDTALTKKNEKHRDAIIEIVQHYRKTTGQKKTGYATSGTLKLLLYWLNRGMEVEDFKKVIDYKTDQFRGTDNEKHIHLATYCREKLFDVNLEKANNALDVGGDYELPTEQQQAYQIYVDHIKSNLPHLLETRRLFSKKEFSEIHRKKRERDYDRVKCSKTEFELIYRAAHKELNPSKTKLTVYELGAKKLETHYQNFGV